MPLEAAERSVRGANGRSALRSSAYMLLAVMLLAGGWVRFNREIAAVAPELAGPVADVADQAAASDRVKGLIELDLLPLSATAEAVAAMGLPTGDAAALTQAVRRGRQRLVRLPLFDLSPTLAADQGIGRSVEVSSGGYTRFVHLSSEPVSVTLPISTIGSVSLRNIGADMVGIGALTVVGPIRLPDLPAGQAMQVGVVVQ